jgi:hypothetical protein
MMKTTDGVREAATDWLESHPSMTTWVTDPTQKYRFDKNVFTIGGWEDGKTDEWREAQRDILIRGEIPAADRRKLFILLKRLRGTYAKMPEDSHALSQSQGVDVFVLQSTDPGGANEGTTILWHSPYLFQTEMLLTPTSNQLQNTVARIRPGRKLPGLLRSTRGPPPCRFEIVQAEELSEQWATSSTSDCMVPTAIFHPQSIVLAYNGKQSAGGHFTLLRGLGVSDLPSERNLENFLYCSWLPKETFTTTPLVFDTFDFLQLWGDRWGETPKRSKPRDEDYPLYIRVKTGCDGRKSEVICDLNFVFDV